MKFPLNNWDAQFRGSVLIKDASYVKTLQDLHD